MNNNTSKNEVPKDDLQAKNAFYNEKLERAKTLLTEITAFTSNVFVPPENNGWIFPYLLELIGLFEIVPDVCLIGDFCDDLEYHLFNESPEYTSRKDDWKKSVLFDSANMSKYSESLPNELETLAAQISEIMNNPVLPKHLYNVISDEIETPENVLTNLKRLQDAE